MPELSGTKMVAAIERSTGQNRTADTVAQRKVDKAAGRFEVAHFSKSGSVRVVDEPAGERDVTAEFFGRNIPQTQGMRVNQCLPLFVQDIRLVCALFVKINSNVQTYVDEFIFGTPF